METIITNEMARKIIADDHKRHIINLDEAAKSIRNENDFEKVMLEIIYYKMVDQHPDYFLNCYVTNIEEYDSNNCNGYSFYQMVQNKGSFKYSLYGLTGKDMYDLAQKHGKEKALQIYQERAFKIISEAMNTDNIIMFCIEHIHFSG